MFLAAADYCTKCNGVLGLASDLGIPTKLVNIISLIYTVIQIGVPLILIIIGMFDMGKAITQQKEDEIKKAQGLLVKKAIAAALVFLMFSIVSLVFSVVAPEDNKTNIWGCVDALINNCK